MFSFHKQIKNQFNYKITNLHLMIRVILQVRREVQNFLAETKEEWIRVQKPTSMIPNLNIISSNFIMIRSYRALGNLVLTEGAHLWCENLAMRCNSLSNFQEFPWLNLNFHTLLCYVRFLRCILVLQTNIP